MTPADAFGYTAFRRFASLIQSLGGDKILKGADCCATVAGFGK